MILFPAIDVKQGRAVRLLQGRAQEATDYGDPVEAALRWRRAGAAWLHMVDLDGAFTGEAGNLDAIARVCALGVPVQLGGGIRTMEDVEDRLARRGVARVILGTAALENPALVAQACRAFPGRVACGIDAKGGRVAVRGWVETGDMDAVTLALRVRDAGVNWVVYTDISRDGMLRGPNVDATRDLIERTGLSVIGSGGVGSLDDLRALRNAGCAGAIIGKALYHGSFTLEEALAMEG